MSTTLQAVATEGWWGGGSALAVPDVPTGLIKSIIKPTSFTLSWDAMPRASSYKVYKGGVLYSTVTTNSCSITGLSASTAYSMTVIASNATGDSEVSGAYSVTTAAVTDILTACEARIVADIEALTTAGGYNFTWGKCNEIDMAKKDVFPNAEIRLSDEKALDTKDSTDAASYSNDAIFEVAVCGSLTTLSDNPDFSINVQHNKALDDLKKVFAADYHLNENCLSIRYAGMKREYNKNGDVTTPGKMITKWTVSYSQDRTTPTLTCN